MIKDTFYLMLKALFVLEIFKFLSRLLGYKEKRLNKKWLISTFITPQIGQQIITMHILANISRKK